MRKRVVIALLLLLVLCAVEVYGDDRHTIGFPDQREQGLSIDELIQELYNATIIQLGSGSVNASTLTGLVNNLVESGLLNETYGKHLYRVLTEPPEMLIGNISNPELRSLLQGLLGKESVSPSDIDAVLKYIDMLKATGNLNPLDEVIAYRVLTELASKESSGLISPELPGRILSTILNIAGMGKTVMEETPVSTLGSSPVVSVAQGVRGLPAPVLPSWRYTWPGLVVAAVALFPILVVLAMRWRDIMAIAGSMYTSLRARLISPSRLIEEGARDCISIYRASIRLIASRYRVEKSHWETHREYLEKVARVVPSRLLNVFEEITRLYEACRFGYGSRDVELAMAEKYVELVKMLEQG